MIGQTKNEQVPDIFVYSMRTRRIAPRTHGLLYISGFTSAFLKKWCICLYVREKIGVKNNVFDEKKILQDKTWNFKLNYVKKRFWQKCSCLHVLCCRRYILFRKMINEAKTII